ncbi:unnamed protein product, partial [Brassica oleracea var. botrytis]
METEPSNCQFAGKDKDFNLTAKKRHVKNTAQSLRSPNERTATFLFSQFFTASTYPKKRNQKKKEH